MVTYLIVRRVGAGGEAELLRREKQVAGQAVVDGRRQPLHRQRPSFTASLL
jgi:hypothetical protein